jgi:energy-coupling factor transporter ATP-binding protein EcfA2
MISELRIADPKNTCIKWWDKVKWLEGQKSIEFKPGLNILWGPNGSGKTTIIRAIARMLHAEQGGSTHVTQSSMGEVFDGSSRAGLGYRDGAMPIHDGQVVMHFDPSHAVGMMGGAFDDDFFTMGVMNTVFKGSAGQTTLQRFDAILTAVIKGTWPEIQWKHPFKPVKGKTQPKDTWDARCWAVASTLEGTLPAGGPKTILLDEPDRSLDLSYQWGLWDRLAQEAGNVQIIAASHSLLALKIPGAHYIETMPGYLVKSERVLDRLVLRHMPGNKEAQDRVDSWSVPVRDPRTNPKKGDVLRVPRDNGTYQIRQVTEFKTDQVTWTTDDKGKKGGTVSLTGWQKTCKKADVLMAAP